MCICESELVRGEWRYVYGNRGGRGGGAFESENIFFPTYRLEAMKRSPCN